MKKIVSLLILFCILTILFLVGWHSIVTEYENSFTKYVKAKLSTNVKIILKETLFIIPDLKRNIIRQKRAIENYETIINEKTGRLYDSREPNMLADLLYKFMIMDNDTLKSIGLEGRKNVLKKFDVEKMCNSTFTEYKKLIQLK